MTKVIEVKNLSKTFSMATKEGRTLKDMLLHPFSQAHLSKQHKALENINFSVEQGEFFGLIGKNGSGKSTLLNILMGSIRPDAGSYVHTKGKMIRLALGLGFDPNLSARDNIYVNGSILGLTFKRIGLIFDDIIQFAELEDFVDTPVKQFSTGMMAKLKFSVAVHAEADIFLMDEFFGGVGDISFKQKSEKVFKDTFLDGRTIIHVSHNLPTIEKHCRRVLVINDGQQIGIGGPKQMTKLFKETFPQA
jgi:ABC-2 type transport system ATP-binding protein